MLSEAAVYEKYCNIAAFLAQEDAQLEPTDITVYEEAVLRYELLHEILEIAAKPRWCS
jgi:hypothetical protein